jgi:Fic family protein
MNAFQGCFRSFETRVYENPSLKMNVNSIWENSEKIFKLKAFLRVRQRNNCRRHRDESRRRLVHNSSRLVHSEQSELAIESDVLPQAIRT